MGEDPGAATLAGGAIVLGAVHRQRGLRGVARRQRRRVRPRPAR